MLALALATFLSIAPQPDDKLKPPDKPPPVETKPPTVLPPPAVHCRPPVYCHPPVVVRTVCVSCAPVCCCECSCQNGHGRRGGLLGGHGGGRLRRGR